MIADGAPTGRGNAPSIGHRLQAETSDVLNTIGRWRITEFVLFFCLIFEGTLFGLPLPFNQLVTIAIIMLALIRRPTVHLGYIHPIVPTLTIALFYIAMISMFADPTELGPDWKRRLIRLTLTAVLVLVLIGGRIDFRSAIAGLGTGMIFNVIAFYAGFAPDYYPGFLSGYFEDKNVAGMAYAVFGILMLVIVKKKWLTLLLLVVFAVLVWDTGSRTALAALAAGVVWILLVPRLTVLGRLILGLLIYLGVNFLAEDYSQVGVFSGRSGSDALRSRIDAASAIKVHEAGFFGSGLGEAYIVFPNDPTKEWYFHNSYLSALVEGGWPWLVLVLAITILFALRPFTRDLSRQEIAVQAAAVALLVCAWRLGEVLFTIQWAVVIAFAVFLRSKRKTSTGISSDSNIPSPPGRIV